MPAPRRSACSPPAAPPSPVAAAARRWAGAAAPDARSEVLACRAARRRTAPARCRRAAAAWAASASRRRRRATSSRGRTTGDSRSALRLHRRAPTAHALLHGHNTLLRPVAKRGIRALGRDRLVRGQRGAPLALFLSRQAEPGQRAVGELGPQLLPRRLLILRPSQPPGDARRVVERFGGRR